MNTFLKHYTRSRKPSIKDDDIDPKLSLHNDKGNQSITDEQNEWFTSIPKCDEEFCPLEDEEVPPNGLKWLHSLKQLIKCFPTSVLKVVVCCVLTVLSFVYLAKSLYCIQVIYEDKRTLIFLIAVFSSSMLYVMGRNLLSFRCPFTKHQPDILSKVKKLPKVLQKHWDKFCIAINEIWKNYLMGYFFDNIYAKDAEKFKITCMKTCLYLLMLFFTCGVIVTEVLLVDTKNARSLMGIVSLLLIGVLISNNRRYINLQTVTVGIFTQLLLAVLTMRTGPGFAIFKFFGSKIINFVENIRVAQVFLFGESFGDHHYVFSLIPILIFFGSTMKLLLHIGIVDILVRRPSIAIRTVMGTTAPESINSLANMFFGSSEAVMLIKPCLPYMTNSEIFAVMTNGMASLSGMVLTLYISLGIPANHLVIASVLSAPASLTISKIVYPETKVAPMRKLHRMPALRSQHRNAMEAVLQGAIDAVYAGMSIICTIISLVSIFNQLNTVMVWLGQRICVDIVFSFSQLLGYLLYPVTFLMGVPTVDCLAVSMLIGEKIFINEFFAYSELSNLIKNRRHYMELKKNNLTEIPYRNKNGLLSMVLTDASKTKVVFIGGILDPRSEIIATYAMCGFANIISMGVCLGGLVVASPSRKSDITKMGIRALICSNMSCFLTGCMAGLLLDPERI